METSEKMQECISAILLRHYPPAPLSCHASSCSQNQFARKWQIWKEMQMRHGVGIRAMFRCWQLYTRFLIASKQCRWEAKQRRLHRMDNIFAEAKAAAANHDIRALYRAIRKLAPKRSRERIKLKDAVGRHLTLKAELDHLHDRFQQVFADLPPEEHAPCLQTMRLSEQEISEALAGLPTWKAAPLHCQPNLVWKVFAPAIAPALYKILQGCIQNQMIPKAWQDSWLILLPKPGKLGKNAKDLRPISLQDPGGKALLKQLTLQARTYCLSYLCALPLYGYLPYRGTADALQRVFSHCFEAESLCKANTYSIHRLRQGHQTTELAGGLQLAIDISAAFDRVERERLWLAMEQSEIPPDLAAIIQQWHLHAHYHIEHAGLHRSFRSTRGVRQGCVCAPLLWVLYTKDGYINLLRLLDGNGFSKGSRCTPTMCTGPGSYILRKTFSQRWSASESFCNL